MTDARGERRKWWSLHVRAPQTGITFEKGSRPIGLGNSSERTSPGCTECNLFFMTLLLVVVRYLDFMGVSVLPYETEDWATGSYADLRSSTFTSSSMRPLSLSFSISRSYRD